MPQVEKVTRRIKSSGAGQNIDFENSQKSTALDSIISLQALQNISIALIFAKINQREQLSLHHAKNKTYSSRDSHVVTHRSTNLPFNCLCMAERTGCPVFS
jgi:hypothetical protein